MLWWSEQGEENKEKMRRLVESGQLEIVTGGWVMNDEANAHYWAIVQQLTEGHEWLLKHLGVKPKHGWAIDPFGHSATSAYLLKQSKMEGSIIQRVHYSVKKRLARCVDNSRNGIFQIMTKKKSFQRSRPGIQVAPRLVRIQVRHADSYDALLQLRRAPYLWARP